jgi:hypothetical protein
MGTSGNVAPWLVLQLGGMALLLFAGCRRRWLQGWGWSDSLGLGDCAQCMAWPSFCWSAGGDIPHSCVGSAALVSGARVNVWWAGAGWPVIALQSGQIKSAAAHAASLHIDKTEVLHEC